MEDNSQGANQYLRLLRESRIRNYVHTNYTGEKLVEEIRLERRKELCFEGHRWFDLRRTTRPEVIKNYMDADWNSLTVTIRQDDPKYIIPYPKEAIQNNPELNN